MEMVRFRPCPETDGMAEGLLHTPLTEMEVFREWFPTVVVCPGGGYEMVSQREADPVALQFFARGYNVFTLTYSVGEKARAFRPLRELSETVAAIREHPEWRCDPERIAVCGFSAGGHLAGSLGTMWNDPEFNKVYDNRGGTNRPNAMILCYPVITAGEFAHVGSLAHVSGCRPGTPGYEYFSLDRHVSPATCPTFLWHTVDDSCVPVENTLSMIAALQRNKISYEAHLFPQGSHGLSVCTQECGSQDDYNARWMSLCLAWLDRIFQHHL